MVPAYFQFHQIITMTSLVTLCLLGFLVLKSHAYYGNGYDRILGSSAVHKYCGENGDECMFSNQCCDGFECEYRGGQSMCRKIAMERGWQSDSPMNYYQQTSCMSNLDCDVTECCVTRRDGMVGPSKRVCSTDCSSWTMEKLIGARDKPPVGNFQGADFWERWQRRVGIDKRTHRR